MDAIPHIFSAIGATIIIRGHGYPANLAQMCRHKHAYLIYLRGNYGEHIDNRGDLGEAY